MPLEVVWEELRRIDRRVNSMSDAVAIEFDTAQREGLGTSFRCTTEVGPLVTTDQMTFTDWVDGSVMVHREGLVTGGRAFTLRPKASGTTRN